MEIALAVAVLGLMGGCGGGGGGGDGGSSGPTPPTGGLTPPPAIQFGLGGTVSGLAPGTSVTLANGAETVQVANNGTFTFGNKLNAGTAFNIKATPTGGYTCRVTEGTGTIAAADSTKTAVACAPVLLAGSVTALQEPQGVAADSAGNLYVLDGGPHAILKIAPSGTITTLAGGSGKPGLVDGQGAAARFRFGFASDVLVDPQGNLFVSDDCNGAIRKVTPGGLVTTLAGNGSAVCNNVAPATPSTGADGTGNAARFERPQRMVFDGQGGVIVLDAAARASVRRVSAAGVVTTTTYATPAGIAPPSFYGIARGTDGTLYFSDFESRIWKDVGGTLVLHAGGASGVPLDGTGAAARFGALTDMVVGPNGDLFVGDASMVRRVTPAGVVTTLAGSMTRGFADGVGTAARFSSVRSIGFDGTNVIVLDNDQGALRRVSMDGTVTTLSATPALRGHVDASGAAARFNWSSSLSADADGSLYVADSIAHVVRKTTPDGNVTTIAGRAGVAGTTDSAGGVPLFNEPLSVAAGRDGSIWVAQTVGLRRILNGAVSTVDRDLRANNLFVEADGNAVVTSNGTVPGNGLVQRVTAAGAKTELVNKAKIEALLKTSVARFAPQSVVADAAGNLYISDTGTVAVYKLTKAGELSVFAGTPLKEAGDVDGAAGTATLGFYEVEYMTIDEAGNLYLSGQGGVRKISPAGVVSSPAFDWGNASIGAVAYAKGRLYGMTRYAILQSDTK